LTDQIQPAEGPRRYLEVLWRRKWFIIVALVVIPAAVVTVSLRQPTRYSATARMMAQSQSPSISVAVGTNLGLSQPNERELQTLASFAVTREIATRAAKDLGWADAPAGLMKKVTAEADPSADVINVTAEWRTPEGAADLANAFARQFLLWRQETLQKSLDDAIVQLDERISATRAGSAERTALVERRGQLEVLKPLVSGGLTIGEAAQPPTTPSSPKPLRDTAVAVAAALVLGSGLAFLREALDVRLHSAREIAERISLPVLAEVPEFRRRRQGPGRLIVLDDPRSPGAESYRFLRTNLEFVNFNHDVRTIVVTSPLPSQGKSTTIANLAIALLDAGKRVAVVDADLRRPSLHRTFEVGNTRGVSSVVSGAVRLREGVQRLSFNSSVPVGTPAPISARRSVKVTTLAEGPDGSGTEGGADAQEQQMRRRELVLLPSGPLPPNPGEMVGSQQFGKALQDLGAVADYVLVDAPPMFAVGDTAAMAPWVDGLLVVLRLEETTADTIRHVEDFLARTPTRALGVVITGVHRPSRGKYYYAD